MLFSLLRDMKVAQAGESSSDVSTLEDVQSGYAKLDPENLVTPATNLRYVGTVREDKVLKEKARQAEMRFGLVVSHAGYHVVNREFTHPLGIDAGEGWAYGLEYALSRRAGATWRSNEIVAQVQQRANSARAGAWLEAAFLENFTTSGLLVAGLLDAQREGQKIDGFTGDHLLATVLMHSRTNSYGSDPNADWYARLFEEADFPERATLTSLVAKTSVVSWEDGVKILKAEESTEHAR